MYKIVYIVKDWIQFKQEISLLISLCKNTSLLQNRMEDFNNLMNSELTHSSLAVILGKDDMILSKKKVWMK